MGLAPGTQNSPYALYHRKRGEIPEVADQDAMERGRVLEPYVAGKFWDRHPEFGIGGTGRELYAHPARSWQLATPDRVIREVGCGLDPVAVLETKTDAGGDDWGE